MHGVDSNRCEPKAWAPVRRCHGQKLATRKTSKQQPLVRVTPMHLITPWVLLDRCKKPP